MRNFAPVVSVIVPTYNRQDLLMEAIQSVLEQTFQDFEVIVIDDGSADRTEQAIRTLNDHRITYIYESHKGVPASSRNVGIKKSQGEYIAFLDSDDVWLPKKLEQQIDIFHKNPDIDLVYAQAIPWFKGVTSRKPLPSLSSAKSGLVFKDLFLRNFISALTVMIRRTVVDKVGLFDEEPAMVAAEDYELWLRIARVSQVRFLPEAVGKYRIHSGNISRDIEKTVEQSLAIVHKFEQSSWIDEDMFNARLRNIYMDASIASLKRGMSHLKSWTITLVRRSNPEKLRISVK